MKNRFQTAGARALVAIVGLVLSATATAGPVDLSSWISEGGNSSWNVAAGNNSVLQSINGDPTVFFDPTSTSTQNTALTGRISVQTSSDDDFIGFVLGYDSGDITASNTDFLLIDWKQRNQSGGASVGLSISRVTDSSNWWNDFWAHQGGVSEIARATNLGSSGWVNFVEYDFSITFTSDLVEVFVDGVKEIDITAADAGVSAFDDGAFGFYNMSQSRVSYSAITQIDCQLTPNAPECQSVPAPPALVLFGMGLLAVAARSRRLKVRR